MTTAPGGSPLLSNVSSSHVYIAYPPAPTNPPQPPGIDDTKLVDKLVDKSEALYGMYLERADKDDIKITEKWKNECDVMLIFVSTLTRSISSATSVSTLKDVDRSVFSCSLSPSCSFCPGHTAELTRYHGSLYREYLSYLR